MKEYENNWFTWIVCGFCFDKSRYNKCGKNYYKYGKTYKFDKETNKFI